MRRGETRDFYIDRFGRVWNYPSRELCMKCGQPDNCGDCNHRRLSKASVGELGGRQSCLLSEVWSFPMYVSAKHWASLAPSRIKPWRAPAPTVKTVRDVRRLSACVYCSRMSASLAKSSSGPAHIYCLVVRHGPAVLESMSSEDLGKATLDEIVALDMKGIFMSLYKSAKRRERREARRG